MKDSCAILTDCLESFFDDVKRNNFEQALTTLKMSFSSNINLIIMNSKSNGGNVNYVLCKNIDGFRNLLLTKAGYLKDNCQRFKLLKALDDVINKYMMSKDIQVKESISILGETVFAMLQEVKPCK